MADAIGARPRVCVFGRLRVVRGDGSEVLPRGYGARVLLLLVVFHGGAVSADQAAEVLWPEERRSVARDRLKNHLSRLRAQCGPVVARDGPLLVLQADTDLAEFERAAVALSAFAGLVLAPDAYFAEWAADTRRRIDALRDALAVL